MSDWIKNVVDKIKSLSGSVDDYKQESIIQSLPTVACVNKAKKLVEELKLDEAEQVLNEALDISTQDALVYKYLGKIYELRLNFSKAIQYYQQSSKINQNDKDIWLRLGMCQLNNNMYEEAITSFEKANKVSPLNTEVFTGWGMTLMRMKKFALAHDKFLQATQISKYNFTAILLSAIMEIKLGDYDSAEVKLGFLAKVAPNESSLYEYANLKLLKLDYEGAETYARKALDYNKQMLPAYLILAEIYSIQKQPEKTEEVFKLALENDLENEILHYQWAKSCARFFDFEQAKKHFEICLEKDAGFKEAKLGVAFVNSLNGDFSMLDEFREKSQDNVYIQEALGLEFLANDKPQEAIDQFRMVLKNDEKQTYNYLNLARAYQKLNDKIKVREAFERFVLENPQYFAGLLEYSQWLLSIEDFADAQRKLRKACKLRPTDVDALNMLFYVSYRLVKENVCEYNVKEAISIADRVQSLGDFKYESERQELDNILINIQGKN